LNIDVVELDQKSKNESAAKGLGLANEKTKAQRKEAHFPNFTFERFRHAHAL
jgi:hypothetical protein